jgi:hypothetical protein
MNRRYLHSRFLTPLVAALVLLPNSVARADLGFWSQSLVGIWRHPSNGDVHRFRRDATYTFTPGAPAARRGKHAHWGFWRIEKATAKEAPGPHGPVALILKWHGRSVQRKGREVVLRDRGSLRLLVDVPPDSIKDTYVTRYIINGVRWIRVRP